MSAQQPDEMRKLVEAGRNSCDHCRARKRKCNYSRDKKCCSECVKAGIPCEHTHVLKTRPKRRLKNRRMDNFEDRVQQLEAMMRSYIAPRQTQNPNPGGSANTDNMPSLIASLEVLDRPQQQVMGSKNFDPPIMDHDVGVEPTGTDTQNVLSLSSFTHPVLQSSLLHTLSTSSSADLAQDTWWSPAMVQNLENSWQPSAEMIALCHRDLPSAHEASLLLQEYLMDFNSVMPLFDRRAIALHFQDCYSGRPDVKGVSWGSLYVVLGIAHHLRAMSPLADEDDNIRATKYLGKCMRRLPDLLMDIPSLPLIQCLLGVAIILKGSWQAHSAALFVSTAMRMAQDMGYNQARVETDDNSSEARQENLVFWIALLLDADLSLRSNRLPTQSHEHIDTELPEEDALDGAGIVNSDVGNWKANILRLRAELALQQAKIMEELFSVKARRRLDAELMLTAGNITRELDKWRDHWLFQINPNDLMRLMQRSEMVHILMLEAAYFLTVCALQTELVQSGRRTDCAILLSDALVQSTVQEPPCYPHARRFLEILAVCPSGDMACTWVVLDAIIIASCVLLKRASLHPQEELSRDDIRLTEPPVKLLTMLAAKTRRLEMMKIQLNCEVLLEMARQSVVRRPLDPAVAPAYVL